MTRNNTFINHYASYRFNPENFSGANREFAERHNSNIPNIRVPQSQSSNNSYFGAIESGSPNTSATSSGSYMSHSYFGNCGKAITTCVG